jgi:c-di-GMP-binding flagellar brake protein YcgR
MKQGTRVEIKGSYDDTPYITTVDSVLENGRFLLDIMRSGGNETRLSSNKPYELRFFSQRGVFKYSAVLRGYMKKGNFDFMLFHTVDPGQKIQRRQSFRLLCGEDVSFNIIENSDSVSDPVAGYIRDISSGGVRLLSKTELDLSHLIQLHLPMIDEGFWVYCAILSKKDLFEEAKYKWQYGVEFIGATDADTEKIVKYVHNEQQKSRSRE